MVSETRMAYPNAGHRKLASGLWRSDSPRVFLGTRNRGIASSVYSATGRPRGGRHRFTPPKWYNRAIVGISGSGVILGIGFTIYEAWKG